MLRDWLWRNMFGGPFTQLPKVFPSRLVKNSSSASCVAFVANARANACAWPVESLATAMGVATTGSTSSTARRSEVIVHNHVWGTMQALSPLAACANSVLTESVSTWGLTVVPARAKAASI